jgi:hypothetical protein
MSDALNSAALAATTGAYGVVQLAASGGTTAGTVVQATDARLSDTRNPPDGSKGDIVVSGSGSTWTIKTNPTLSGALTVTGSTTTGSFFRSSNPSAANGSEFAAFQGDIGADATHGALNITFGGLPSATGANRYAWIGAGDNSTWRKLYVGGKPAGGGQVLITATDASSSTSTGALVIGNGTSGGLGVGGSIFAGNNINSDDPQGKIQIRGTGNTTGVKEINLLRSDGGDSCTIGLTGSAYAGVLAAGGLGNSEAFLYNPTPFRVFIGINATNRFDFTASQFKINPTTGSTNTTTGALVVSGGVGAAGNINTGGWHRFHSYTTLPGAGSMGISSTFGLNFYAITGSSYDFTVFNAAGSSLILNPTGTSNLIFPGNATIQGGSATLSNSGGGSAIVKLTSSAGQFKIITTQTAGVDRWYFGQNTAAETGSNAGSEFFIAALTDAGAIIDSPITITRAAGGSVSIVRPVSLSSTLAVNGVTTLSSYLTSSAGIGFPGALTASGYYLYSAANNGLTLYGYGSTYDVYIGNRAGTRAISVAANSTTVSIPDTTNSSSTITGALVVGGGLGIAGNTYIGGNLVVSGTISPSSGAGLTNVWIPASQWIPRTTNGCGVDSTQTTTNLQNFDELLFDPAAIEYAQALVRMPSNYNNGTVTARFFWSSSSSTGSVVWGLQARAFADDDALDTAFGTAQTVTDTLLATGDMHISAATSAVTSGGTPAATTPLQFQIYRDATNGSDTLGSDARLLGVEISFTSV